MPDPTDPNVTAAASAGPNASAAGSADETTPHGSGKPNFGPPAAGGEVGTLGPYRVVKQLGAGGMGAVYLALDTRLDRKLALKVMLPAFAADRDAKERFLREAKAAAKISHDNVVTVYEADERDGVPYIAMQFLQGYPLDEYLRTKGAPPIVHAIRIAREAALGLAAAHELGLVHRDIKPGNIWLEAPNGRVKVLDFGLAKPVGAEAELTRSGAVVGTPAYMSPEQARGLKVDARTDLFSLGGLLYRLCTGRTPFAGPNVMAVLMALGSDDPTPVRELNPNVPEPLAQLIHQLLAKKPEHRPQTATEVAKRLRGVLEQLLNPGAAAASPGTPAGDLSVSRPVVVHALPVQPPIVVPMEVTATPESAFANLTDDDDTDEPTHAEPADVAPRPKAERKPAAREPKTGGKGVLLAAGAAVLLAAGVVAAVVSQMGKKGEPETNAPDVPSADANKGGKAAPRGWEPPKPGAAVAPGPSPFDALDPAKIPAAERGPWLPAATVAVVGGHAGMHDSALTPRAAVFSPDGKWVAAANDIGVWIWDAATLRPRYYHPAALSGLAFSPDGRTLAFGCGRPDGGQMVRLIDLSGPEPKPLKDVAPRWENGMRGIAFLPDGKSLVTATGHGGIYLWDLTGPGDQPTRVIRKEVGYQKGAVSQLTLSADGTKVIVTTDDDGNKRQLVGGYDIATGKELFSFPQPLFTFAASPAADRVVSLRETGGKWEAVVRDVTGAEPKELGTTPVPGGAEAMVFAPDGKTVFFAGWGWESLWEMDGGALRKVRDLPPGTLALSPDLSRVLQAKDRRAWLLDGDGKIVVRPGDAVTVNHGSEHWPVGAGGTVVTTFPGTRVWAVKDGALVAGPAAAPNPPLLSTTASPDGAMIAAECPDTTAAVVTFANNAISREVRLGRHNAPADERIGWHYWHPDAKSLLTYRGDEAFELWDATATPPTKKPFPALSRGDGLLAFAPAGDFIAMYKAADPASLVLRSLTGLKPTDRTLPDFPGERRAAAAFTPDGKALLVSYSPEGNEKEGRIRRFDVTRPNPTGEVFAAFPWVASQYPFFNLHASRDGTKLLAHTGTQVRVFDLTTRAELLSVPLTDSFGLLHSYTCWADNGRHLLLGTNTGMVYVLRVPEKNADRAAAEWALSVGTTVTLREGTETVVKAVGPGQPLPNGPFVVTGLYDLGRRLPTAADLTRFEPLPALEVLALTAAKLPATGWARLRNFQTVHQLNVAESNVSDADLEHVAAMRSLRELGAYQTAITDAGLARLGSHSELSELNLNDTSVTDTGVEHLAGCRGLVGLRLMRTKVTAAGVEKLAKALPKCQIEWDGGVIEPAKK